MANKKVSQLTSKPSVLVTDLFPIADPTTGQLFKTTISALGTAIGSGVSSVNTLVGAVVLDTDDIQELASPTNRWYTDTRSRAALSAGVGISYNSGTGVITNAVTSGLIATALGYTPADDALVVKLAGSQTITGTKTFQQAPLLDLGAGFKNSNGVYNYLQSLVTGWQIPVNAQNHNLIFSTTTNYVYTFPNASGTIALTSDLGAYLPLAGGTMTGAIVGTTATFTNAGSGIGLGVTLSGATGDGIKITHSAGRAFNIQSSGSGYGILINNETASTSAPFTIQKQGANKITFSDLGAGIFASGLTAETLDLSNTTAGNALRINHTNTSYHAVSITATGGSALYATGSVTVIGTLTATGVVTAQSGLANGSGQSFTLPSTTGTLALTSQLSSYLPLSGGTLTGALNGTTASFTDRILAGNTMFLGEVISGFSTIESTSGNGIWLRPAGASSPTGLRITTTGAATFSSSVDIAQSATVRGFTGTTGAGMFMAYGSAGAGIGSIFSYNYGTSTYGGTVIDGSYVSIYNSGTPRMTITGGNVGIGTTAPQGGGGSTDRTLSINSGAGAASFVTGLVGDVKYSTLFTSSSVVVLETNAAIPLAFNTNGTERMRITSGGNVGIGTTSPSQKLAVVGDIRGYKLIGGEAGVGAGNYTIFSNDDNVGYIDTLRAVNSGDFHFRFDGTSRANINRSTGAYTATSDSRLKTNISDSQSVLSLINQIKVRSYKWIENDMNEAYGLIAQELYEILPEYVYKPKIESENWGLSKAELVPMLVKAVQELKAELDTLKNK